MVVDHPRTESTFHVPAITAGTAVTRNFEKVFRNHADSFRTLIKVSNRAATTLTVTLDNGKQFRVGEMQFLEIAEKIWWYTIDADLDTNADEVEVFEGHEDEEDE